MEQRNLQEIFANDPGAGREGKKFPCGRRKKKLTGSCGAGTSREDVGASEGMSGQTAKVYIQQKKTMGRG